MITIGPFLVFMAAVSLPVTYLYLISRWLNADERETTAEEAPKRAPLVAPRLVEQLA